MTIWITKNCGLYRRRWRRLVISQIQNKESLALPKQNDKIAIKSVAKMRKLEKLQTIEETGKKSPESNMKVKKFRIAEGPAGLGSSQESLDHPTMNSRTYVYESDKSFRRMTLDVLPREKNYLNLAEVHEQRPTLDQLMEGKKAPDNAQDNKEEVEVKKGKVIKFGWLEGVLMRCLLNIWGTMLFLRLTWLVGQAGIIQGLLIITLCNVVTVLSAISMSAVATNGQIAGGGVYYMISRALGPSFGGSIGIMFTIANTISVATYTIGFSESVLDFLQDIVPGWTGIVEHECKVAGCRPNDVRIIGGPTLFLFLVIAFAGMDWVTRIQKALLVLLVLAQFDMFFGSFIDIPFGTSYVDSIKDGKYANIEHDQRHALGYTGWSMDTAAKNTYPNWAEGPISDGNKPGFMDVFGVFFTAVTGIVAGANLSGDLKDPAYAIPKGTLWSIGLTYVTYMFFAVTTGFVYLPAASGIVEEFKFHHNNSILLHNDEYRNIQLPRWDNCSHEANAHRDQIKAMLDQQNETFYSEWQTGKGCMHGSGMDQMTMTYISFTGYLRYAGGFSASLSSAIASLVGAPRVLQAVGKDKIYPFVDFFAKGYTANNDPFRGYIIVFIVAFGCCMITSLNEVSMLASNFFLAAYALINFSCFHSSLTKSPSWRPSYKWYNPWVSLFSAFLCIAIMFALSVIYASITFIITGFLGIYIYYRNPEANWGSSTQGQVFVSAIKSAYTLAETPDHVKNYRPKLLVFTGNPAHRPALVDFANLITKKVSLLLCGHVLEDSRPGNINILKENVQMWLKDHNVNSFYTVAQSNSFGEGARNCMSMAGLGKLSPNLILLGFKSDWKDDLSGLDQYVNAMYSAFDQQLSVAILRVKGGFDYSDTIASEQQITKEVTEPIAEQDNSDDEASSVPEKKKIARKRNISVSFYRGEDGHPLEKNVVENIQLFKKDNRRTGFIDVWWLYDDGGLTLLLPHILTTRKQFSTCKLRVFSLANRRDELDKETRNMAALLSKFRIDYSDVIIIPDILKKAEPATKAEFNALISDLPNGTIPATQLEAEKEKTNRHLRLAELLRHYSSSAEMVVMTLPLPRRGHTCPPLFNAWMDFMTRNLPPVLLVRGNQTSVITFYS